MLYTKKFKFTPKELIQKIEKEASNFGFIVREVFDMKKEFEDHGVDVEEDFEFYSIMICNPKKAYESIVAKPVRGAVLLPPKQITIYKEDDITSIAYEAPDEERIIKIFPEDKIFQKGLYESGQKIIKLIESL